MNGHGIKTLHEDEPNGFASENKPIEREPTVDEEPENNISVKMGKRKGTNSHDTKAKVAKIEEKEEADRHEVLVADGPDENPPIFRLIDDCCHKIFSYLLLDDLHSFGLTCKWAQQVAGNYFQSTHRDIEVKVEEDRFTANGSIVNGFSHFFRNLCISHHRKAPTFQNIGRNCGESIKHLRLHWLANVSAINLKCLKNVLQTVECLKIEGCEMSPDVAEKLLKLCPKLKRLCIRDDSQFYFASPTHAMIRSENAWLLQKYPTIEHLELCVRGVSVQEMEMETFFNKNPNVQSFAIDSEFLLRHVNFFNTTKMKIETLIVRINFAFFYIEDNIKRLSELYERGVYQKLYWYSDRELSEKVKSLQPLDKCLERVYVKDDCLQQILLFLRDVTKLKEIKVIGTKKDGLDLVTWNNERKKVIRAEKVTIFVDNGTFVATKTKLHQTNYECVALKQDHSNKLDRDFDYNAPYKYRTAIISIERM